MRIHVRTVCFSAWFLMGTRLMQSYCLCICVYILLPSPITFGLVAQFQPTLTGGVEVPGVLLLMQALEKSVNSESKGAHHARNCCSKSLCGFRYECKNNRMVRCSLCLCKTLLNSFSPRSWEAGLMASSAVGAAEPPQRWSRAVSVTVTAAGGGSRQRWAVQHLLLLSFGY